MAFQCRIINKRLEVPSSLVVVVVAAVFGKMAAFETARSSDFLDKIDAAIDIRASLAGDGRAKGLSRISSSSACVSASCHGTGSLSCP